MGWDSRSRALVMLASFLAVFLALDADPAATPDALLQPLSTSLPVRVGDRFLSRARWLALKTTLSCWMHSGRWARAGSAAAEGADLLPPLYDRLVPTHIRNPGRHRDLYSDETCGPVQERVGLDLLWAVPRTCARVPAFSPAAMCRAMRGRTLVFIGDSLMIGQFEAMIQAMAHGRPDWDGDYHSIGTFRHRLASWDHNVMNENPVVQHLYSFCADEAGSKPFRMMLTINWKFRGYEPLRMPPETAESAYWVPHRHFLKKEHDSNGLVFVVNRGAHWDEDAVAEDGLLRFLRMVHEDMSNATVIFRSTNLVHVNCSHYMDPPPGTPPFDPSTYEFVHDPRWHWRDIAIQSDNVSKAVMNAVRDPAGIFLDITPSSSLRPDLHRGGTDRTLGHDCLHFCLPNPMVDLWNHAGFGVLQLIDELASA